MYEENFVKEQQALYERHRRDALNHFHVIACALIKRYFELQPQLADHAVTRFLYDEACDVLRKEEECRIDMSDVTIGECTPCASFCIELLRKYREMNIHREEP